MKFTPIFIAGAATIATLANTNVAVHAATTKVTDPTKATVKVVASDTDDNQLYLSSAPDFHFTQATVTDIYQGFKRPNQQATHNLEIIDTRTADHEEKWQLDVALSAFKNDSDVLNPATVTLKVDNQPTFQVNQTTLKTGDKAGNLANGLQDRGTLTLDAAQMTADLDQEKTPTAKAKNGSEYSADLTWTLTTTIKAADAL